METFDVVVLGSGAAALAAAVAAHGHGAERVGMFEKADVVGGTSAMSGGMIWIPCNHHMAELGLADSREDVLRYLDSLSHDRIIPELAEAYVDTGPEMLRWFEENTPVMFEIVEELPRLPPRASRAGRPSAAARSSARCSPSASSANGRTGSARAIR